MVKMVQEMKPCWKKRPACSPLSPRESSTREEEQVAKRLVSSPWTKYDGSELVDKSWWWIMMTMKNVDEEEEMFS